MCTKGTFLSQYKHFYVESLEKINEPFSSPLTKYHHYEIEKIQNRKQSQTFVRCWDTFKNCLLHQNIAPIQSDIMDFLQMLQWISEFVLQSIGKANKTKFEEIKLDLDLEHFHEVQAALWNFPPFDKVPIDYSPNWSQEVVLTSL